MIIAIIIAIAVVLIAMALLNAFNMAWHAKFGECKRTHVVLTVLVIAFIAAICCKMAARSDEPEIVPVPDLQPEPAPEPVPTTAVIEVDPPAGVNVRDDFAPGEVRLPPDIRGIHFAVHQVEGGGPAPDGELGHCCWLESTWNEVGDWAGVRLDWRTASANPEMCEQTMRWNYEMHDCQTADDYFRVHNPANTDDYWARAGRLYDVWGSGQ